MRPLVSAALVFAASAALVASNAGAATLNLTGSVGSGIASGTDGSVTYSGNSAFGDVTFLATPSGSDITWTSGSGLGINCPYSTPGCSTDTAYQIDTPEIMTVRFDDGPLYLTSVDIALLSTTGSYTLRVDETGSIVGTGFDIDFDSDNATNGALTVQVNRWVTSIRLIPDTGEQNDFTLARLRIDENRSYPGSPGNPIPEPSSVLLMLVGAGIVATQVRRHI